MSKKFYYNEKEIDRIISMSWEDRTPFESIEFQFGLNHNQLEKFLKIYLKRSSYILWKKRVQSRFTKHQNKRSKSVNRFKCSRQRNISNNKISKR
tara:strand:+ start:331 stop:615 length:285 start_codon:yes stop_codon:yes gene_type:complete